MPDIALVDAIQNLRNELLRAVQAAPPDGLLFELGPIEMQLEVEVTDERAVKGGLKWWLIEAGAETKRGLASTHRINLTLEPKTATGERIKVSAKTGKPE